MSSPLSDPISNDNWETAIPALLIHVRVEEKKVLRILGGAGVVGIISIPAIIWFCLRGSWFTGGFLTGTTTYLFTKMFKVRRDYLKLVVAREQLDGVYRHLLHDQRQGKFRTN